MSSENKERAHFSDAIDELIASSGLKMKPFAEKAGVNYESLKNWRSGIVKRPQKVEDILKIILFLGLSPSKMDALLEAANHPRLNDLQRRKKLSNEAKVLIRTITNETKRIESVPAAVDLDEALVKLAELPLDDIPPVASSLPVGSFIDFKSNPLFVGRDEELSELAEILKGDGATGPAAIAAITGVGGMGKTQLAVEFAQRYGPFFAGGVFWVNMGVPKGNIENSKEDQEAIEGNVDNTEDSTVREAIVAAGSGMPDLPVDFSEMLLEDRADKIRNKWQEPVPRLLIFDNCENSDVLDRWRPKTGGSRLLVTCRRAKWDAGFGVKTLPLKELGRKQSLSLLHKTRQEGEAPPFDERDESFLDDIADELGDLPLALHLAGHYLAKMYLTATPCKYLKRLRKIDPLQHPSLQNGDWSPTRHEQNVARTFMISYEQLDSDDATDVLALQFLMRTACFAPGVPIPYDLLIATINTHEEDRVQEDDEGDALYRLTEIGLLQKTGYWAFVLHRLIWHFVRSQNDPEQPQQAVDSVLATEAKQINDTGVPEPLLTWQEHLRFAAEDAWSRGDGGAVMLCYALASHLHMIGEYEAAKLHYRRVVAVMEAVASDDTSTAICLGDLGRLLHDMGELSEARIYHERALTIYEKVLGDKHPDTATGLNNLGTLLQEAGEYDAARLYYEQALSIRQELLGDKHHDTAQSFSNLGGLLQVMGEYDAAKSSLEQALAIQEKVFGNNHPDTAASINNLGELLRNQGEYEAAKLYYERTLNIWLKVFGEQHPNTATAFDNLANVLREMGEYDTAKSYYESALSIRREVLGDQHHETAMSFNNLGLLLREVGEYDTARRYFENALSIHNDMFDGQHPKTALIINNLGMLMQDMGEYESAKLYLKRALGILLEMFGEQHPETATSLNNLGLLSQAMGELEAARDYYESALNIWLEVLGEQHPNTATSLNNLGNLLQSIGNLEAAKPYHERALTIYEEVLGGEHPNTAMSLNNLGQLLYKMGEYKAAKSYSERALAVYETVFGNQHPNIAGILNNLGILLEDMEEYEMARVYLERALAIYEEYENQLGSAHPRTEATRNNLAHLNANLRH